MTPERWQRIQTLCELLDDVPADRRAACLDSQESDPELRREALALRAAMDAEARAQSRHESVPAAPAAYPAAIGGVQIVGFIGSGGSGEVFSGIRTVNGTPQRVAVKWLSAERTRADHLERFAREQQLLASLRHPGIVGLLDAGIAGGRPYLVMDLVDGAPITQYCDAQAMRIGDRLRLMLSVCEAVQAAHHHLIVHLDLKPSNVLVSTDGHPTLLDFGTAKLVDPLAPLTRTEPLTLNYASPERLRNEAVSVACDVYSLGLVLYEVMSGGWPFARRDSIVAVAERAAGDVDVIDLSRHATDDAAAARSTTRGRLASALRGDLDAICRKALAHQPDDRYESVTALADDLRRYAAGEPVRARQLGPLPRIGKFARRHAWPVAGAVVLVGGLALAAIYSAGQARMARDAEGRMRTQNRFLTSLFTLTGTDAASTSDMTVRELLALAETRVTPSLGSDLAVAADVEASLGRGFVSQNAFEQALALFERSATHAKAAGDVAREAWARSEQAYALYVLNRNEQAASTAREALALWRDHRDRFTPEQAVGTIRIAANTLSYIAPLDRAPMGYFESCLEITDRAAAEISPNDRAQCLRGLGIAYQNVESRYDASAEVLRRAVDLQRQDPTMAESLTSSLQLLGFANRYRGRFDEDERAQREALDIAERLNGRDSRSTVWQRAVWLTSLTGVGRAEEAYRESLPMLAAARRFYPEPGSYLLWTPLSAAMSAACLTDRFAECEALAIEALTTLGPSPRTDDPRVQTARGYLGLALAHRGELTRARPLLEGALAAVAQRRRTLPYVPKLKAALAATMQ
jgi:eukaryotic-like serine/threonine-protein kinase